MTENGGSERQSLGQSVRSQARYGYGTTITSNTATKKNQGKSSGTSFIKHTVSSRDTLMGIALKYCVTVEQIKRENKLWTNDSLFLREYLLVPLTPENEKDVPKDMVVVISERDRSASNPEKSESDLNDISGKKKGDVSAMDFLSKYDSTIAQLKSNVTQMEKNASQKQASGSATSHSLGSPYELPTDRDTDC